MTKYVLTLTYAEGQTEEGVCAIEGLTLKSMTLT